MPATYEPIASTTLASDTASYTFSSIPGTYTDLILVCQAKTTRSGVPSDAITIRFNGDSSSNYSRTVVAGDGNSAYSYRGSNETYVVTTIAGGASSNSHPVLYNIMNYSSTSMNKTILGENALSSPQYPLVAREVFLWRSNSSITSISIAPYTGPNFIAGCTFSLYGIKAAA